MDCTWIPGGSRKSGSGQSAIIWFLIFFMPASLIAMIGFIAGLFGPLD
jgi:hypothetical protein